MPIKTYKTIETIVLYFVIKKNLEISFQNGPEHETTSLSFLYNIQTLVNETRENIFESCLKLEKFLTYQNSRDIDANDLCSELQAVAKKSDIEFETTGCIELYK